VFSWSAPIGIVFDPTGVLERERGQGKVLDVQLDAMPVIAVHPRQHHRILLLDHVPSVLIGCDDGESMDVPVAAKISIDGHVRGLLSRRVRDISTEQESGATLLLQAGEISGVSGTA
jgi:hypothetical protein